MRHLLFLSDDNDFVFILVLSVIGFLISTYIIRLIFSIPRIVRTLRTQAYLLAEIAEKQGAGLNDINKALDHIDNENIKLSRKK